MQGVPRDFARLRSRRPAQPERADLERVLEAACMVPYVEAEEPPAAAAIRGSEWLMSLTTQK
jgi:hypothetical protein